MAVIGGQYLSTAVTYANKDIVEVLPTDVNGNLMVNIAAGEEINVGTLTLGTINMIKAGTISSSTINVATINAGTLGTVSAVGILYSGTIGTVTGVGTIGGTTKVDLATLISGEDQTNNRMMVENQMSGTYLQAAGTTTLKGTAAGLLHTITVGMPVASDVITAYDSQVGTSGTVITKITIPATLLNQGPMFGLYDIKFTNGLAVSQTGTSNISVSWR